MNRESQAAELRASKMAELARRTAPSDEQILAHHRDREGSRFGSRPSGGLADSFWQHYFSRRGERARPVLIGVAFGLLTSGAALAVVVSTDVVELRWGSTTRERSEEDESSVSRRVSGGPSPKKGASKPLGSETVGQSARRSKASSSDSSVVDPVSPPRAATPTVEERPRPVTADEPLLLEASWRELADAMEEQDHSRALRLARRLHSSSDVGTRQAVTILEAQLTWQQQRELKAATVVVLTELARRGSSASVRRSAQELLDSVETAQGSELREPSSTEE